MGVNGQRKKFLSAGQSLVHPASWPAPQHAHASAGRHYLTSDGESTPAGVKFHSLKFVTGISGRDNNHNAQLSSE